MLVDVDICCTPDDILAAVISNILAAPETVEKARCMCCSGV